MDEPDFRAETLEGLVGAGRRASDVIFNAAHQSEKESFCKKSIVYVLWKLHVNVRCRWSETKETDKRESTKAYFRHKAFIVSGM